MEEMKPFLAKVADGNALNQSEAWQAFDIIMSGKATPSQIGAFLMALRLRGETVDEITGAVSQMRAKMSTVDAPENAVDIVGTGGTGTKTYNISTCAAMIMAGGGISVAKHGNKALSSLSGSGDVLSSLGVNLEQDSQGVTRCIKEANIGFMFAPNHHSSMRFVGPSRVEMGIRTIFNLLGPLANPANVKHHLIGVFDPQWLEPFAQTLKNLESKMAWIIHGEGGLDEISTLGETQIVQLKDGEITRFTISPEDVGFPRAKMEDIRGGTGDANAVALRAILSGEKGPYRDIVVMNAAAGLLIGGKVDSYADGVELAQQIIDNGDALNALNKLVAVSNQS
ncbi:anthranilate phosphoribosyltransferase [Cohaesibacter gelatinilyticus]|uniref:Anthranilate phosphoribosyltransferase n=1 Tax=Cohaesibacter gelatinilyticus TaxID=372072 RepID=A0A285NEE1_9HYPH|nr:anthranilate phosphoribosyltransferase [Cohaesibacter gelatinilyticus]SNZ07815.1 anthranilate phosphoribosyltransferase [Cohaesibacter gelatinilyticus]